MAAHAYWRVNVTANVGGSGGTTIGLVEFRTSKGGAQAATGGTPIESGHFSSFVPANAFDTNPSTWWASNALGTGQYIGYHFASAVDILQFALSSRNDTVNGDAPKDFTLDWSDDGVAWTTARTITGQTGWTVGETRVFTTDAVTTMRLTQEVAEVVSNVSPKARLSQAVVEIVSNGTPRLRMSQIVAEIVSSTAAAPPMVVNRINIISS